MSRPKKTDPRIAGMPVSALAIFAQYALVFHAGLVKNLREFADSDLSDHGYSHLSKLSSRYQWRKLLPYSDDIVAEFMEQEYGLEEDDYYA